MDDINNNEDNEELASILQDIIDQDDTPILPMHAPDDEDEGAVEAMPAEEYEVSEATEELGIASRIHLESEWARITEEPVLPNLNAMFLMALVLSNVVTRVEALEEMLHPISQMRPESNDE